MLPARLAMTLALILAAVPLTGCLGGPSGSPGSDTEEVRVAPCEADLSELPATAQPGEPVSFQVRAVCADAPDAAAYSVGHTSSSQASGTQAYEDEACRTDPNTAQDPVSFVCTFTEPGTVYLRPSVTVGGVDGERLTAWGPEYLLTVTGQDPPSSADGLAVHLEDVRSRVLAGAPFQVTVVTGTDAGLPGVQAGITDAYLTSEPVGPAEILDAGVRCFAVEGPIPGEQVVTCRAPVEGTWYLRGHAVAETPLTTVEAWSAPAAVLAT